MKEFSVLTRYLLEHRGNKLDLEVSYWQNTDRFFAYYFHFRDKDALMKRVRQYVRAIESARVTSADIYYHERHSTKTDQHINNSCSTSSGNKMLDKFSRLYTEKRERPEPYNYDEGIAENLMCVFDSS